MKEKNISVFGSDVLSNEGYIYTNTNKLSCKFSNERMSKAIFAMAGELKGKRIIDIGCGDGCYTRELLQAKPAYLLGIDANEAAIQMARKKSLGMNNIHFAVIDIYNIPEKTQYDIAIVRGLLHHLYQVEQAIASICKIAQEIIVVEPNGYNPILKIIEKTSPYHLAHEEKSYAPRALDNWFINHGAKVIRSKYIGLVPMFCPDSFARVCKFLEPFIERIPLLRNIACGQYVQKMQIV